MRKCQSRKLARVGSLAWMSTSAQFAIYYSSSPQNVRKRGLIRATALVLNRNKQRQQMRRRVTGASMTSTLLTRGSKCRRNNTSRALRRENYTQARRGVHQHLPPSLHHPHPRGHGHRETCRTTLRGHRTCCPWNALMNSWKQSWTRRGPRSTARRHCAASRAA